MNKPSLHFAQRQELSMTVELREAIELLQLSSLDVLQMVAQEVADNPCLERESTDEDWGVSADGAAEGDWEDTYASVSDAGMDGPVGLGGGMGGGGDESTGWESTAHTAQTLQAYVWEQYAQVVSDPTLRRVGKYLIEALDEAGYVRVDEVLAARQLGVSADMVDDARAVLQTLDPVGIGARDLAECLRLQLHAADNLTEVAEVCVQHLDKVAAREVGALARLARCSVLEIAEALEDLRACNPRPASAFTPAHGAARVETVVPDVVVESDGNGCWRVELNGAAFPKLHVNAPMRLEGAGKQMQQAKAYMSERHGRAKWLVSALEQRAASVLKIARAIVAAQGQFLEAGGEFLVPLTLKQVAEKVGVHESTVSRVTTGKYMLTPRGMMEFKTFFASGVGSTGGTVTVASRSVQAMIQRFVNGENPAKPLSDQALVKMLQGEGVEVARRTVAKYRGVLNIPGTAERRVRAS